jgi:hypothetical protein
MNFYNNGEKDLNYLQKKAIFTPNELIEDRLKQGASVIIDNLPFGGLSAIRIRHIEYDLRQRFCLKCGKILPLIIPKYYTHECVMPDFVKDKLNNE